MAHHQLAHRHERKAQGSFRRCPGAGRRRTTTADQGQGPTTSARRRGLAHRRTQDVGREQILSRQPASEDQPAHLSNHHQGALGLRAGSPADERRTWSRPLRGTILARPSPSCAYDDDRLRLPPASPARNSKAGKKDSTGPRLSQLYPPCATPSSNFSLDYRRSDARIVENGFAASSGVNKSAKVVLGGVAEVDRVLGWTPSHIVRPGFVDHIGERAVRADCPPHTGISFIWNNMREGFGVGHRATPRQPAGTGRRQYLVAYTLPKGT